jgi:hypothetical protein
VDVAWMMLANHAEAPPNGLLYLSGAGWDTVNVSGPVPPGAPQGTVTFLQGALVVKLEFHKSEADIDYPFQVTIVDADGGEVGRVEGTVRADSPPGTPPTWPIAANLILPLTGLPVRAFGEYRINISVNREHKGDLPFRVIKLY